MTALPSGPLVAWLGDDFTGSAAVMEVLEFAGLSSVLFLDIPTAAQRARFAHARAIGIATTARSHGPEWMQTHLPAGFAALAATGARVVHYKVCSTLDSAPHAGSIGRALELGLDSVPTHCVPFLVAAPPMRRYQAFGHLFAAAGDGVFRLDRHPVMAQHPVTPMAESDVARHLSAQTSLTVGNLQLEHINNGAQVNDIDAKIVTLDCMSDDDLIACGRIIWPDTGQTLCGGSQGVEYALVAYWRSLGLIANTPPIACAAAVDRMIAVSGSVSPTTATQITWAENNGFDAIPFDAARAATGDRGGEDEAVQSALDALNAGRDPLIHSARGPDDPRVHNMRNACAAHGIDVETGNARVGAALGRILQRLLHQTGLRRAVISGGDTSGHATRQLDIYAFTALAPTTPGAALLTAHSDAPRWDGLQLALKGGQMGSTDYFGWIKRGAGAAMKGTT